MHYDYIIIGSGAGGAAAAWRLASTGSQVLLLEKGDPLPRDGSTLDVEQVIRAGRFKSREPWLDKDRRRFAPEEHFNLGGKTKWYGAALLRYSPREFEPEDAHQCLGWPIGYADLEPYYALAEQRLGVRVFAPESDLAAIVRRLGGNRGGWQAEALPLALAEEITEYPEEAAHFDAFASPRGLKGDAESGFLQPACALPNLRVRSGQAVVELLGDSYGPLRLRGVMTADGEIFEGRTILLAAGALHSPRLLQQYFIRTGLDTRLPCATQVGRYYKQHLLTALVAFTPRRQTDLLRKTLVLFNERVPHSSVQPLGFDGELIGALMPGIVPRRLATALGQYAYGFFLQTEDGSDAANRIIAGGGLPQMDYDPRRLRPGVDRAPPPGAELPQRPAARRLPGFFPAHPPERDRTCLRQPGRRQRSRALGRRCNRQGARHGQSPCRRRQRAAALEPRQSLAHHLRLVAARERPVDPICHGNPRGGPS